MPSCTIDGVFGIARTTGTPGARCRSISEVGMGGHDRQNGLLGSELWRNIPQEPPNVLRLHRDHDEGCVVCRVDAECERRDPVALAKLDRPFGATVRGDDLGLGERQPEEEGRRSAPLRSCPPRGRQSCVRRPP